MYGGSEGHIAKMTPVVNWRAPWKNRSSRYISFSTHHSVVFYFRCSVYWWKTWSWWQRVRKVYVIR